MKHVKLSIFPPTHEMKSRQNVSCQKLLAFDLSCKAIANNFPRKHNQNSLPLISCNCKLSENVQASCSRAEKKTTLGGAG